MNIFLIGYRCTGKTTVGKALAGTLSWTFVDTDQMVAEASGMTIARMVEDRGWPFFREREFEALTAVCAKKNQVVATGGGIILDPRNVSVMKDAGGVVWLTASQEIIQTRMLGDEATAGSRPALTDQGLLKEIETVLNERSPLYANTATLVVDTDQATVETICKQIIKEFGNSGFWNWGIAEL